jgi:hypothetical protein
MTTCAQPSVPTLSCISAQELAMIVVRNGEGLSQGRLYGLVGTVLLSTVPNVLAAAMT